MKPTYHISIHATRLVAVASLFLLSSAIAETKAEPSWAPVQFCTIGTDKQELGGGVIDHWWHGTLMAGLTSGNLVTPAEGQTDASLGAFDRNGKLKWVRQYDEDRGERFRGVKASFWHGIRVASQVSVNNRFVEASIRKLDGRGKEVWAYRLPTEEGFVRGIGLDGRGRSYMASIRGNGPSFYEVTLWVVDRNGMLIKKVPVSVPGGRLQAYALTQTADGALLIEGSLNSPTSPHLRTAVVKMDTDGKVLWTWMAPAGDWLPAFGIHVDPTGRMLVVGNQKGELEKTLVYAVSKEGQLIKRVELAAKTTNVYRVCTGNNGRVYLAGGQYGAYLMLFTLDDDLNEISREVLDPTGYVSVYQMELDRKGRLLVSGSYSRTLFGHPSKGQSDQFFVRLENKQP